MLFRSEPRTQARAHRDKLGETAAPGVARASEELVAVEQADREVKSRARATRKSAAHKAATAKSAGSARKRR